MSLRRTDDQTFVGSVVLTNRNFVRPLFRKHHLHLTQKSSLIDCNHPTHSQFLKYIILITQIFSLSFVPVLSHLHKIPLFCE
ncbi:hypothetical protein DFH28DRAFT_1025501 [Melampsora americana]|nr:hypothetical protein DFH28DRAFT_1025501 [Melampsora americana]